MLTEMIEYGWKIKEEVQAIQSEIKKNIQGNNSEGKEINGLEQEERNIQPDRMKKQEFKKNKERLRNLQENFKHSNIQIIGVPKGEEEEQEIENLFENIMKENFPQSGKGNRLLGSPGSSESQRSWTQGSTHQDTS